MDRQSRKEQEEACESQRYAPSWQATAIASASSPLVGVGRALDRLSKGRLSSRISQTPPGDGNGVVPVVADLLRLDIFPDVDDLLSPDDREGRDEDLDLSL